MKSLFFVGNQEIAIHYDVVENYAELGHKNRKLVLILS
jgi:hypothetical protein